MSAARLREAAELLRNWWPDCDCHKAERAVADWLDEAAEHLEIGEESDVLGDPCPTALEGLECSVLGQALMVANAYLAVVES